MGLNPRHSHGSSSYFRRSVVQHRFYTDQRHSVELVSTGSATVYHQGSSARDVISRRFLRRGGDRLSVLSEDLRRSDGQSDAATVRCFRHTGTGRAAGAETWAVHGQATITTLLQPRFRSPYQGPQRSARQALARLLAHPRQSRNLPRCDQLRGGYRYDAVDWRCPELSCKERLSAKSRTAARPRLWRLRSRQRVAGYRGGGRFHRHQSVDLGGFLADRRALGAAG